MDSLDTTIGETDYVDSGHIRLGIIHSVSNGLDVRAIEILDHRVSGVPILSEPTGAAEFDAYVGEYKHIARGNVVKVLERNGAPALDISGQRVLTFKEPDAGGAWRSTVSGEVFVTFDRGDYGSLVGMRLHQTVRLPRTGPPVSAVDTVPAEVRPYPGVYVLQQAQAQFTVVYENSTLIINDPLAKRVVKLKPSDRPGVWIEEFGKFTVHFEADGAGKVTAMLLNGVTVYQRWPERRSQ